MPMFRYKAVDASGEVNEGQLDADNREAAVQRLQAQGHVPIRVESAEPDATGAAPRGARPRGRRR